MEKSALNDKKLQRLEKAGYRFAGKSKHSAVKICTWCKHALRSERHCYKQQFYGIKSHRCVQMTPAVPFCNHACVFCWRDLSLRQPVWKGPADAPEEILDDCIKAQREILQGFKGNPGVDKKKFAEAMEPNQVAISLDGEPTLYPKITKLVDLTKKRGMTSFLVTNGSRSDIIAKLVKHQPYQLYITLPAPNEAVYKKVCKPMIKDGWQRLMKSLSLLHKFKRSVLRLTLVRGLNMVHPEQYAAIIEKAQPMFVEAKAYMAVGFSRERLGMDYMPLHSEIREFAEAIAQHSSYKIKDEKKDSRVVLLMKE